MDDARIRELVDKTAKEITYNLPPDIPGTRLRELWVAETVGIAIMAAIVEAVKGERENSIPRCPVIVPKTGVRCNNRSDSMWGGNCYQHKTKQEK